MRVQSYREARPHHVLIFQTCSTSTDVRFIKLTCFRANTGIPLRDHIVVIEFVLRARRLHITGRFFLIAASSQFQRRYSAFARPFTTQPDDRDVHRDDIFR